MKEGDADGAILLYTKAIFLSPDVDEYYLSRGEAYEFLCDFKVCHSFLALRGIQEIFAMLQSAISNYRKAHKLNPGIPTALFNDFKINHFRFILQIQPPRTI